jgi:hypothetical protein
VFCVLEARCFVFWRQGVLCSGGKVSCVLEARCFVFWRQGGLCFGGKVFCVLEGGCFVFWSEPCAACLVMSKRIVLDQKLKGFKNGFRNNGSCAPNSPYGPQGDIRPYFGCSHISLPSGHKTTVAERTQTTSRIYREPSRQCIKTQKYGTCGGLSLHPDLGPANAHLDVALR